MRNTLKLSLAAGALLVASVANAQTAETIYGVTLDNQFVTFSSTNPSTISSSLFITGLANNENIAGIDFRPATGQLFAIGNASNLYTINVNTGAASLVASLGTTLNGVTFGMDFNPTVDLIRLTTSTNRNYRVNPTTGAVTTDGNITVAGTANPAVTAVAYTNNFAGATSTQLYGLDTASNNLVLSSNPNAGTYTTVGSLGQNITGLSQFDISGNTGIAYAALETTGQSGSQLYTVNLGTGAATLVGNISTQSTASTLRALTVAPAPVPEPASIAAIGIGLAAMLRRRRNKNS